MKENYVWLSSKELNLMLKGSLQWIDISPRVTSSKAGMRKLSESLGKSSIVKATEQIERNPLRVQEIYSKRLEGQPVIWLLGGVGLLTLSSWFYFVIVSK